MVYFNLILTGVLFLSDSKLISILKFSLWFISNYFLIAIFALSLNKLLFIAWGLEILSFLLLILFMLLIWVNLNHFYILLSWHFPPIDLFIFLFLNLFKLLKMLFLNIMVELLWTLVNLSLYYILRFRLRILNLARIVIII